MRLLEREVGLSRIASAWAQAGAGAGRLVLVSGEAGIGKTSLVARFAAAHDAGVVAWGRCDSLITPRELGPAHDIAFARGGRLQECFDGTRPRTALFAAFIAELRRKPCVFVFEDLHWADEATLDLVKYLGRRIGDTPSMLVVTFRDEEKAGRERLRSVVGELPASSTVRIELQPLSLEAVRSLAGDERGIELHATTGGNPFFVSEVLAADEARVPASVRDAVLGRVARLPAAARAVVELASIEPAGLERAVLETCLGSCDEALAECEERAVLEAVDGRLRFRHELARLAVMEAIAESRRIALHRALLEVLRRASAGVSLARLAHHAEGAEQPEAVLEYATAAARACVAVSAHREAADHLARALRHAGGLPERDRATMLEEYAWQCQLTSRPDTAIGVRDQALAIWRRLGEREREAMALAAQGPSLVGAGRNAEARAAVRSALDIISGQAPTRGHAYIHRQHAYVCMLERDVDEAIEGAQRAIVLAEEFGDTDSLVHARNTIGASLLVSDDMEGLAPLRQAVELAAANGLEYQVATALGNLGSACGEVHRYREAQGYLEEGIAYALQHDLDQSRTYMQSWLGLVQLHRGHWNEAASLAQEVIGNPIAGTTGRIMAWLCIARLRTRRGDPGAWAALDEAMALAGPTRTLQRLAPVAAARAEAAWLDGEAGFAAREAGLAYPLALEKRHAWFAGELAYWQWKGGRLSEAPAFGARAFVLQMEGRWRDAAGEWSARDCPYESARALAEGDIAAQMEALAVFERLGARPAAARVRQALRSAGVKRIPRGPRPSTRENSLGVTQRELEILACLAESLTNAEIAARLHISAKTVDHHVGALLGKLGVGSRRQAARAAAGLGLIAKVG